MAKYSEWRERRLAEELLPSAMSAEGVRSVIRFPSNLRDLRILDIGSGESDAVSWLNFDGAVAYGVDPRYNDLPKLEDYMALAIQEIRKNIISHYGQDKCTGYFEPLQRKIEVARNNFRSHYASSPEKYKAAIAGNLPFEDGFFDFVFSVNAITDGLDRDEAVFQKAIAEALRVLRTGCEVQFYPVLGRIQNKASLMTQRKFLRNNSCRLEDIEVAWYQRLVIVKP